MRRSLVALTLAALASSAVAFAPATTTEQADTDHTVTFSEDGEATVTGGLPGGVNLSGFTESSVRCSAEPDAYCETILLTVEQPVADEDAAATEFGLGEVTIDLTAAVQGGDFDLTVFASDAGAEKGTEVASSGNFLACATFCEVPLVQPNQCEAADECVEFAVATSEFEGTKHFLVEVVYFAAASEYVADLTYARTDGRNADGTTGAVDTGDSTGDSDAAAAPATSVERFDVAEFDGFDLEDAGDWGGGGDAAAVGSALGQDFEAAYLAYGDGTFTFTLGMTELLAAGGTPEATRYGWSFSYNGNAFELDGKFTNYSRGACDPTAGTCPPPRDPGIGYFALRGNCTTAEGTNVTLCEELGGITATFDPATGEIAIPVPAALLTDEVRACDSIAGDASFIGQSVWAAPSAFVTSSAMPFDDVQHFVPLVVPYEDPALTC